ncbi:glycosyltransferase [Aquaticitalea lipolytica]|uniref:glycosyltransferase n=1 Tax=Aquaticitalea lipolytica TaxID=1247562 RepID=UPI0024BA0803|nr:glycosyltransferase [Aquaticitalea lipolytica]
MSLAKINITFILPSLVAGGAERVMSLLAQNIDKTRFNTTLLIIGYEKDNAYTINGIKVVYLNKSRVLKGVPKLLSYIFKNQPDILVSCMTHVNIPVALILLMFPKIKLVTREANIKKVTALYHLSNTSWLHEQLLKISYYRTNKIICQSKDMADEMLSEYHINALKIQVINNPISDEFVIEQSSKTNKTTTYITVGRLHEEKGHARILNVLSKLSFPFQYTIIGDGEAYDSILQEVKRLRLEKNVCFLNYTKEIPKYLQQSDVFLQGSFAEGFPNALLESCAVGTPVLAFEAPGGTSEIVEHGINGFLAKDETDYLNYLNLIYNHSPFEAQKVSDSVTIKFEKNTIIKKYENVFLHLIGPVYE